MPAPLAHPLLTRLLARARWHRRPIAAALLAFAVLLVVRDLRPTPPPGLVVVVATRDLDAGADVAAGDVTLRRLTAADVPDHALTATPVGRVLALPVRRGEVLTDVRLLGAGLLDRLRTAAGPEVVAAPVHLSDAAAAALLRAGDTVDVLGASPGGSAIVAARRAVVLRAPATGGRASFGTSSSATDGVVVLAVSNDEALALARAAPTDHLSVVVRAG